MSNQVRTITYKVQMLTQEGKKEGRAFQTTLTGIGKTSDQVKASLQSLGDKVARDTGAKFKILSNDTSLFKDGLKQLAREATKTERNFEMLTREYSLLSMSTKRTADEQERLNAIYRLGKGATLSQKKEVVSMVREYQRLRGATARVTGSMRNFRGQMNNVGFQLQDIVVQSQMGTSAFVIFSQQGSQLAASIGKNGPLIGAGIALAGVLGGLLFPKLKDTGKATEELNDKMKELSRTTGITQAQAMALTKVEENKIKKSNEEIKQMSEKIAKLDILNQTFDEWKIAQESLANGNASTLNFVNPANALKAYNDELEDALDKSIDYLSKIDTEIAKNKEAAEAIELIKLALKGGTDQQKEFIKSNAEMVKSMQDQVDVLGLSEIALLQRNKELDLQKLSQQNATSEQKASVAAMYDQLILMKRLSEDAEQASEDVNALAEAEKKRNAVLVGLEDQATMLSNLEKKYKEEQALLGDNYDAQIALTERYERDRRKIQATGLEAYMLSVEDQLKDFDSIAMASIENFTQGFGVAFADAVFESENLGEAMQNLFVGVAKNMVAFFAEWAAQELILWTLRQALGKTAAAGGGAAMGMEAQASSLQAGLHAFSSTAAIPIVGPALAPGAMGAALAVTQPMAAVIAGLGAGFAGVYDKGGVIPQDMYGIVSEYGNELVNGIMVKGNQGGTRVTGREETAQMLNGGGSMMFNITSNGNASPDAIANAIVRKVRSGRGGKQLQNALYQAVESGKRNKGKR